METHYTIKRAALGIKPWEKHKKGDFMADGILCKHCGFQESDHKTALTTCSGFVGEREPDGLSDGEMKALEQEARRRHAWGQFSTYWRGKADERVIQDLNLAIRDAHSSDQRKKAEEAKQKFVEDCRFSTGFFVG